jgi:hypothetical protein
LPYPRNILERYGIPKLTYMFNHPEFVPKYDSVALGPREFVVKLSRGGHVEISAVADDGWNVGELYALCDNSNPGFPWSRPGVANARDRERPVAAGPTIRSPPLPAGRALAIRAPLKSSQAKWKVSK